MIGARIRLALAGIAFGAALSWIGFSSWDEVHAMFTFSSLRLTLAFAISVALLIPVWPALARTFGAKWSARGLHPGTVPGGILFGVGWAASGACPSIALVQIGEGQLGALLTLAGVFAGNALYAWVHGRFFRWTTGSCADV